MTHMSLGVIGGMGPKATSVFFEKLISHTKAEKDQDHIDMIILNHASLPDRTSVILENDAGHFLSSIHKDIQLLEHAGVSNIAIPCNTSHFFYDQLQEMSSVNIIHMVEETIDEIVQTYGEGCKVGILATNGTIQSGIYKHGCNKYKLNLFTPKQSMQDQVMRIIYDNVKSDLDTGASELESVIHELIHEEQCSCVILACTELSCIEIDKQYEAHCIDAMDVLVKKAIQLSGREWIDGAQQL